MKKLLSTVFIWCCGILVPGSSALWAIPAKPTPVTITMKDGQKLTVRLHGDEFNHFYTTTDNFLIKQGEDGYFYYASQDAKKSALKVSEENSRSSEVNQFLQKIDRQAQWNNQQLSAPAKQRQNYSRIAQKSSYPTKGDQKGIAILVEFQDFSFTIKDPQKAFFRLLNEEGYNERGALGSAKDYYHINSGGAFNPEFDVYGPVILNRPMSYYGGNDGRGNDKAPEEMIIEACKQLDEEIDFSEYDRDKDGYIDNVYVFYAGYGEADGGPASSVWPHSWDIETYAQKYVTLDGVKLNHYACSNELDPQDKQVGIGTFCHEFNHVLGLPDLYATSYTGAFTPAEWCIMDLGSYNNDGITPPYMNAYERYALDWLTPDEIGDPADLTLESISSNKAFIIKTELENEYFLIENRQQEGWDEYIPGHGMLIWHIDYNEEVWKKNIVNNTPKHQYVDLEEADDRLTANTRAGDAFPGTAKITEFTDETGPSMLSWKNKEQNKPITNITEENGVISFQISGGGRFVEPVKAALEATEVTPVSFKAHWNLSSTADSYAIDVYQKTQNGSNTVLNYVKEYKGYVVTDTFAIINNLTPETEYFYVVYAIDRKVKSKPSNEINVTTGELTFDFTAPVALPASSISNTSFYANWEALKNAESYSLNVYQKQIIDSKENKLDFTDGIKALPSDWTTTCNSVYSTDGYYGAATPALRFNENTQSLTSPTYTDDIYQLSFWYRGANSNGGNSILINGLVNGNWIKLDEISPINSSIGGSIYILCDTTKNTIPAGCKAIAVIFNKPGSGGIALDDLQISYGGKRQIDYLPGYESLEVDNATSVLIDGLKPLAFYYYNVIGFNGEKNSLQSNEIRVKASSDVNGIGAIQTKDNKIELRYTTDGSLVIVNNESATLQGSLYSLQGQLLKNITIPTGQAFVDHNNWKGVYLLKIGNESYKIIL